jgi:hypothetical protein
LRRLRDYLNDLVTAANRAVARRRHQEEQTASRERSEQANREPEAQRPEEEIQPYGKMH